ncbi:hypothetical protein V3R04_26910, partial [Escherichia coli]
AFSSQLAELYGASFGMNVNKRGNLHQINAAMSFVNGKYVSDEAVLPQAAAFLAEVLFHPNAHETARKHVCRLLREQKNYDDQTVLAHRPLRPLLSPPATLHCHPETFLHTSPSPILLSLLHTSVPTRLTPYS